MQTSKLEEKSLPLFIGSYLLVIIGWYLLWLTRGDTDWWLVLPNRAVPYLFLPIVPCFAAIVYLHRARLSLLLLPPCLIFISLYHPYIVPSAPKQEINPADFSIMNFNLLFGNKAITAVSALILTHQPDLIALQEVQPPMMAMLQQQLATLYPHSLMGTENRYGTTAVFSQHPITQQTILDLGHDRPATIIQTSIDGHSVLFASAHLQAYGLRWFSPQQYPHALALRTNQQNKQATILRDYLSDKNATVILGCDCNSYETSSSYRLLARQLNNAARDVGWVWNASAPPSARPDRRLQHIDYIFYRGGLTPQAIYTLTDSAGSDHQPIIATFQFDASDTVP